MEGKDVVGMARTGSGKTAAFLIPMFERLQQRSAQAGARALILSPTRELALQTLKFTKEVIFCVYYMYSGHDFMVKCCRFLYVSNVGILTLLLCFSFKIAKGT